MVGTKVAILDYDVEVVYRKQKNRKVKKTLALVIVYSHISLAWPAYLELYMEQHTLLFS